MGAHASTVSGCSEAEDPAACRRPGIIAGGVIGGLGFLILLCSVFLPLLCSRLKSRRRDSRGDSEQTRRNASSSHRGQRKEHRRACCNEGRTSHGPARRPNTNTWADSSFARGTDSVYPRRERIAMRAPSRPSQASRRPEDREIEKLLCELPTVRCSRSDKRMCTICLQSLSNASATVLPCRHPVHTRCLTKWLQTSTKRSCPTCRARLFRNR